MANRPIAGYRSRIIDRKRRLLASFSAHDQAAGLRMPPLTHSCCMDQFNDDQRGLSPQVGSRPGRESFPLVLQDEGGRQSWRHICSSVS